MCQIWLKYSLSILTNIKILYDGYVHDGVALLVVLASQQEKTKCFLTCGVGQVPTARMSLMIKNFLTCGVDHIPIALVLHTMSCVCLKHYFLLNDANN